LEKFHLSQERAAAQHEAQIGRRRAPGGNPTERQLGGDARHDTIAYMTRPARPSMKEKLRERAAALRPFFQHRTDSLERKLALGVLTPGAVAKVNAELEARNTPGDCWYKKKSDDHRS
jgi:hypothetical protein